MTQKKREKRYKELMAKARHMQKLIDYYKYGKSYKNTTAIKTFSMWRDHALQGAHIHMTKLEKAV